jgi:hypothetical protein
MKPPVVPIILGAVAGAVTSAALFHVFWVPATGGAASSLQSIGLGLTAFTGAIFGAIGASVDHLPTELKERVAKQWRLWLAIAGLLVADFIHHLIPGHSLWGGDKIYFIGISLLLGYLIRKAHSVIMGREPFQVEPRGVGSREVEKTTSSDTA